MARRCAGRFRREEDEAGEGFGSKERAARSGDGTRSSSASRPAARFITACARRRSAGHSKMDGSPDEDEADEGAHRRSQDHGATSGASMRRGISRWRYGRRGFAAAR